MSTSNRPNVYRLSRVAGALSLDFANTLVPRSGHRPFEVLVDARSVIEWGAHAELYSQAHVSTLASRLRRGGREASFYAEALGLREVVFRIFSAVATGRRLAPRDIRTLENAFKEALDHAQLADENDRYVWRTASSGAWIVVDAVARDAIELLTSTRLKRVKLCATVDDCGWLFLDTSRSNTRRWCSMDVCGTKAKIDRQRSSRREPRRAKPALTKLAK